jgi:hypothetical protein
MKKCFVVMQKTGYPGCTRIPECVYRDRGLAEEAAELLMVEGPKAWIEEVPFHPDFNVKGTETGRMPGVPSRQEVYDHLKSHSLKLQTEGKDA